MVEGYNQNTIVSEQMNMEIPNDFAPFVHRMVAERRFLTESDVLAAGLRLLQESEMLREEVRLGFQQLDDGKGIDSAEVYRRAEQAIEDARRKKGAIS